MSSFRSIPVNFSAKSTPIIKLTGEGVISLSNHATTESGAGNSMESAPEIVRKGSSTPPVRGAGVIQSESSERITSNPTSFTRGELSDMTRQLNKPQTHTEMMTGGGTTSIVAGNTVAANVQSARPQLRRVPQLRIVEDAPAYKEELRCPSGEFHSLHDFDIEPSRLHPLLARALIERFSSRGDVVLDPSARFGTAALEACLIGRDGIAAEIHPVLASICGAKITPGDIAEVALMCQTIGMRRPVGIELYREHFSAHYEVETYRELVMLRALLGDSHSRIDNVVRALTLSLMHGPSAGYLSVASPLSAALGTEEQHAFNAHRRQRPDYRAVLPRLLKRAAGTTRDGLPSFAVRSRRKTIGTLLNDPRRLENVETGSVDLIVTEPMLPLQATLPGDHSWLRNWFVGATQKPALSVEEWMTWLNESLLEWARVLKANHRAVLVLGEYPGELEPELVVTQMVRQQLGRFFAVEGTVIERAKADVVRGARSKSGADDIHGSARILVLKRR